MLPYFNALDFKGLLYPLLHIDLLELEECISPHAFEKFSTFLVAAVDKFAQVVIGSGLEQVVSDRGALNDWSLPVLIAALLVHAVEFL